MNTVNLVKMLHMGRVDAVLTAEEVFTAAMTEAGLNSTDFRSVVEMQQPVGLYLSKVWTKANPAAWEKLKAAAKDIPVK